MWTVKASDSFQSWFRIQDAEEQFYKDLIKVAEAEYSKYLQQLQEEENDRD